MTPFTPQARWGITYPYSPPNFSQFWYSGQIVSGNGHNSVMILSKGSVGALGSKRGSPKSHRNLGILIHILVIWVILN